MEGQELPVSVSRRIEAPAADIFRVLADPTRHIELDGSGMLRGAVTRDIVTGVGDVFVMAMYYSQHGDYEMNNHVVEFEPNRRIAWEPVNGQRTSRRRAIVVAARALATTLDLDLVPDGANATTVTEMYDYACLGRCARDPGRRRHLDRRDDQDVGAPRPHLHWLTPGSRLGKSPSVRSAPATRSTPEEET